MSLTSTQRRMYLKMFGCDTVRVSDIGGKLFLLIGTKRSTKDDPGQWYRNGEPIDFDYVAEKVIASGHTFPELLKSAREYKRLCGMSMEQYLRRQFCTDIVSNRQQDWHNRQRDELGRFTGRKEAHNAR